MSRQFKSTDTSPWIYGFGNGHDGPLTVSGNTTFSTNRQSISGTSGSTSAVLDGTSIATGDLVLIHQSRGTGAGNWELNKVASGGSTSITLQHPLQNTYTDSGASQAQIIQMREYSSVTVNSGINWYVPSWDGNVGGVMAFFCSGAVSVAGTINGVGRGFRGGNSNQYTGYQGESAVGLGGATRDVDYVRNGAGGGGGLGNNHATNEKPQGYGGGGGYGGAGQAGYDAYRTAAEGGTTDGNAALTDMLFGGGGGGAANLNDGGYWLINDGMAGENGGGIILIIAQSITVTGAINCSGNGQASRTDSRMGYGGGGAGGSVLIKAQTATLGTNKVTAAGGVTAGTNGDGGVGRIHLDYRDSYSGSTSPTLNVTQDSSLDWLPTEESYSIML